MFPPRRLTSPSTFPVRLAMAGAWGLTVGQPLVALAQQPAEKGGVARSDPGATRGYTFEAVVVVALLGLALFSVCRTSRRV